VPVGHARAPPVVVTGAKRAPSRKAGGACSYLGDGLGDDHADGTRRNTHATRRNAAPIPVNGWNGERSQVPHRDAAIYTIFEGTSEIQRLVIARTLSGMSIR
jgi:hypothetical protein